MNIKIVCNGSFKVSDQGDVWKIQKDGTGIPANVVNAAPNRRGDYYQAVYLQKDGTQKHYFVHRLIAEAFVPNPENKPCVIHKDWDLKNNRAENLEWVTHKERMRRSCEMGFYDPEKHKKPCLLCGTQTASKDQICVQCKYKQKVVKKHELRVQNIKDELMKIDLDMISKPRDRQIIEMRMKGCSYEEIGKMVNISRERVRQILDKAKTPSKYSDLEKLKIRLKKKKLQAESLELDIKLIESKINLIEEYAKE